MIDYEQMYELAELPDSALGEELISLRREIDAREAEFAAKLAVFERHKGYSVPEHCEALSRLGPTIHHRRSFAPVAASYGDLLADADEIPPSVLPL